MLASVHGQFHVVGDNDLDAQTDAVMEALLAIEEASEGTLTDSDVTASLRDRVVTVSVLVEADSVDDAQKIGVIAIEAAIRLAGGNPSLEASPTVEPSTGAFILEKRTAELVGAA